MKNKNDIAAQLRIISTAIEKQNVQVQMPEHMMTLADEEPFVDKACEAIEYGGSIDATCLASLICYIADAMET